ncbi:sufE-like protein 1, chloroplastic/mitochondrial [Salvia divinorum]|uniref:SufE-like protein 1, chloroplastic/mitochondrial n=1 Tax=Salvia divinorum TaxID=28513 RepID=A0ABD1I2R4_SALDI
MTCIMKTISSSITKTHFALPPPPTLALFSTKRLSQIPIPGRKLMSIPISSLFYRSAAPFFNPSKTPTSPYSFFFSKNITFQRISTKQPALPSPPPASFSVEELPPKLQEIVKLFQGVQEPKAKYEQLLF